MRKWTTSACVVLAVGLAALLAVAGYRTSSSHPAQANTSIATSTTSSTSSLTQPAPAARQATLTTAVTEARPAAVMTGSTARTAPAASWTVRPGDTLTAIAAALAVPGGWPALYAANRQVIGPDPGLIQPGTVLALPRTATPARYTVTAGDTLTGIAAALALPGGWHALYTANQAVIGPDPGIIRPGTILTTRPAAAKQAPAPVTPGSGSGQASPPARPSPSGSPSPRTAPGGSTTPASHQPAPASSPATAGTMPRWLKNTLLAAALLTLTAFLAELGLAASRRRRHTDRTAPLREPARTGDQHRDPAHQHEAGQYAAERTARIIEANHERLIVTYSTSDDTVYLLTPPGEDPRAVLRAARLVLPENTYQELAGHLGVSPGWPE